MNLLYLSRRTHLYLGLGLIPWFFMYAVSSVPFSHNQYFEALDKASPRVSLFKIGKSEEGRDIIVMAIADEATIKTLDKYKKILADLTDPRKLTDAQAKALVASGK